MDSGAEARTMKEPSRQPYRSTALLVPALSTRTTASSVRVS